MCLDASFPSPLYKDALTYGDSVTARVTRCRIPSVRKRICLALDLPDFDGASQMFVLVPAGDNAYRR